MTLSTLPPPTPRALPPLPVPRTRPTKANVMVKHRPLSPLPPSRFHCGLWEVSPDPSTLPPPYPKNFITLPSAQQHRAPADEAVSLRPPRPSSTMATSTQSANATGTTCPEQTNTNRTTQSRCHANVTTTGTQNRSL